MYSRSFFHRQNRIGFVLFLCLCILSVPGLSMASGLNDTDGTEKTMKHHKPIYGDYGAEIREKTPRKDGIYHIDTPRLIRKLRELHANTYYYLIGHARSDWNDLCKEFLPAAKKANIQVWAYLVPPSEFQSFRSEPFASDYISWSRAIGSLSKQYPNLKGIVMDDFNDNFSFFSPSYLKEIQAAGKKENPDFQFYVQVYYPAITPEFAEKYHSCVDGVVMSFRDDGFRNTQRVDSLIHQIDEISSLLHEYKLPLVLMIYASKLSATPISPSSSYVEQAIKIGLLRLKLEQIQGVITYVLHKEHREEKNDHDAHSGNGYGSLFVPPNRLPRGSYIQLQQKIYIPSVKKYQLTFSHFSVHPLDLRSSPYYKELLVDGKVVWKEPIHRQVSEIWKRTRVDLTPYLSNKKSAILSLRLIKKEGRSAAWTYSGFDHLVPGGFELSNPDFENKYNWTIVANNRSMLADILLFDPIRQKKTYHSVQKHYAAFHFYNQVVNHVSTAHIARIADRLLTCVILNQQAEAARTLKDLAHKIQADPTIPQKTKKLFLQMKQEIAPLFETKLQIKKP